MLDSFLYWMGLCRPCLSRVNRMMSITDLAINKDIIYGDPDYDMVCLSPVAFSM